jgi:GNAT superfamily N-acetyltransferase
VAEDKGEIVAYATAFVIKKKKKWDNFDVGYLCDIFVLPSFRGKGLGKRMTRSLVSWLNKKKVKRIKADAYVGNPAVGVWENMGMKPYSVGLVLEGEINEKITGKKNNR